MATTWIRAVESDGRVVYQLIDTLTNEVLQEARSAYDVAREKAITSSVKGKLSQTDINEIRARLESTWRGQGKRQEEIGKYLATGRQPKSPEVQTLIYQLNQNFPKSQGWRLEEGPYLESSGYIGNIGVVAHNTLTGATALIDTHTYSRNKLLSHSYMHFLKHAYLEHNPGTNIQGVYQLDYPTNTRHLSRTSYTLVRGMESPEGLRTFWGIGGGFFGKKRNLDEEALANATLDTSTGLLKKGSPGTKYKKIFTVFDTETEDVRRPGAIGKPVEINAKKFGITQGGEVELIDTYEKYYVGRTGGEATSVSGYTKDVLEKLQGLTGQKVGSKYRRKEDKEKFLSFIEGTLVGHNIVNFDFNALGLEYEDIKRLENEHGIIDTLQLARNFRLPGADPLSPLPKQAQEQLFQEFFGQPVSAFGIKAHGAGGDVTALAMLIQEWMSGGTEMGKALKAVLTSPLIMNIYTASRGTSTDALGQMFYDNKGHEYTAEEVIWMAGLNNGNSSGGGFNTNIVGVLQQVEDAIKMAAQSINSSAQALAASKQASESEYANLGAVIAATQGGNIERLVGAASRAFPEDLEQQLAYIEASPYGEEAQRKAKHAATARFNQQEAIRQAQRQANEEYITSGEMLNDLQAGWHVKETQDIVDAYNAAQKNPLAHWDTEGNYVIGERGPVVENGWVDKFNEVVNAEARLGESTWARTTGDEWRRQIAGKTLNESFVLPSFHQDDKEYEEHLRNIEKEASLWEKVDKQAIGAVTDIGVAITQALFPQARRSDVTNAIATQASSVNQSLSWMPLVNRPLSRLTAAGNNMLSSIAAQQDYTQSMWNTAASAITGIGTGAGALIGGPVGAIVGGVGGKLLGGLVSGVAGGGWETKSQTRTITQIGQGLSNSFNLFGALFEMIRVPFVGLNKALHITTGLFNKFNRLMGLFNGLNLPYTNLTSVTYGYGERLAYLDAGLGLSTGSVNRSHNEWATAQMNLYNLGQLDTNRIVASAMLGVFSDVYANGGDTTEQYARTVNKLSNDIQRNPGQAQRIMALAGQISPTMQTELSMMSALRKDKKYANITYQNMMDGSYWGIYTTPAEGYWHNGHYIKGKSDYQSKFYATRFGLNAARQELIFQGQRIGTAAWDQIGRPVADALLKSLSNVVTFIENGQWGDAWEYVKDTLKKTIKWVKQKVGINEDEGAWDILKAKARSIAGQLWPLIQPIYNKIIDIWSFMWEKLLCLGIDAINSMSQWHFDIRALLGKMGVGFFKDYAQNPVLYRYGEYDKDAIGKATDESIERARNILARQGYQVRERKHLFGPEEPIAEADPLLKAFLTYGGTENTLKSQAFQDAVGAAYVDAYPDESKRQEALQKVFGLDKSLPNNYIENKFLSDNATQEAKAFVHDSLSRFGEFAKQGIPMIIETSIYNNGKKEGTSTTTVEPDGTVSTSSTGSIQTDNNVSNYAYSAAQRRLYNKMSVQGVMQ